MDRSVFVHWNASHMRPTFLLDLTNRPVSAIADAATPNAMHVGMRVTLVAPFDTGSGTLPGGINGTVTDVDGAEGIVEITMEGEQGALYLWQNKLILVPFETEDLLSLLRCHAIERATPHNVVPMPARRRMLIASAILLAFTAGWMLEPPIDLAGFISPSAYASPARQHNTSHAHNPTHVGNITL